MVRAVMKKILLPLLIIACCAFVSVPALAESTCGDVETSVISCNESDGNPIWGLLLIGVNVLAGLVGVVAIGGFVYAAILYSSAGDQAGQVTKAKTTIANVVVGLVLFAGMYSFMQFLVPGGVFNRSYSAPEVKNTPQERSRDDNGNGSSGGGSGTANDPACTDGAAKKGTDIVVSFQNLGREEASATAVFQMIKNAHSSKPNVIYNFAEINEGDTGEDKALMDVFGSNGWAGVNTRVPSLAQLDNKWKRTNAQVIKLHDAVASSPSPKRVMTVAQYARTDSCATKFATINTHFLTHAYNNPSIPELQRKYWDPSMKLVSGKVAELRKAGYDVIVTADFNNPSVKMNSINPNAKIVVKRSPDYIVGIPAEGRRMTIKNTGTVDTPSGEPFHKAWWARVGFN